MENKIEIGSIIKISNGYERFWVKVISKDDDFITGEVANKIYTTDDYDYGSIIRVTPENVYDIYEDKNIHQLSLNLLN